VFRQVTAQFPEYGLYGVLRDSAYKIRRLAETEKGAHIKKGWWKV
jgi:hypothetical protein